MQAVSDAASTCEVTSIYTSGTWARRAPTLESATANTNDGSFSAAAAAGGSTASGGAGRARVTVAYTLQYLSESD